MGKRDGGGRGGRGEGAETKGAECLPAKNTSGGEGGSEVWAQRPAVEVQRRGKEADYPERARARATGPCGVQRAQGVAPHGEARRGKERKGKEREARREAAKGTMAQATPTDSPTPTHRAPPRLEGRAHTKPLPSLPRGWVQSSLCYARDREVQGEILVIPPGEDSLVQSLDLMLYPPGGRVEVGVTDRWRGLRTEDGPIGWVTLREVREKKAI